MCSYSSDLTSLFTSSKELLSIFLEEAQEVLATIGEHISLLHQQPQNADFLTNIRRGFHTLKGSGRMVGLKDLGETAWAIEQVMNIAHSTVMQDAWARGQKVTLHGWCYSLNNGHITNLEMTVPGVGGLEDVYNKAVEKVAARKRD